MTDTIYSKDHIVLELQDRNPVVVSRETGISIATIRRLKNGHTDNPEYQTLQILSKYFDRNRSSK